MATSSTKQSSADDAAHAVPETSGDPSNADGATIDAVLADLEQVVTQLEGGDLPLEEALSRFERGVALARRGGAMLDRVEERVEVLLADRDETVPMSPNDE